MSLGVDYAAVAAAAAAAAAVDIVTRVRAGDRPPQAVTVVFGASGTLARVKVDDLVDAVADAVVVAAAVACRVIHAKVDGREVFAAAAGTICLGLVLAD